MDKLKERLAQLVHDMCSLKGKPTKQDYKDADKILKDPEIKSALELQADFKKVITTEYKNYLKGHEAELEGEIKQSLPTLPDIEVECHCFIESGISDMDCSCRGTGRITRKATWDEVKVVLK